MSRIIVPSSLVQKATTASEFMAAFTKYLPAIQANKFPKERLDNARQALEGAVTPLPNEVKLVTSTPLTHGICNVAIAEDGTIAICGPDPKHLSEVMVMVAEPGSTRFKKIAQADEISRLFFPDGSNIPAYLRRDHGPDEWSWSWNGLRLQGYGTDKDRPLFWMRDKQTHGAHITTGELHTQCGTDTEARVVEPAIDTREPRPTAIRVIDGRLVQLWKEGVERSSGFLVCDNLVSENVVANPYSITTDPDGKLWFTGQRSSYSVGCRLFSSDGELRILDIFLVKFWSYPGKIFAVDSINDASVQTAPVQIFEVISGWKSNILPGAQISHVWPARADQALLVATYYDNAQRRLIHLNKKGQAVGKTHSMPRGTAVRKVGKFFVFKYDDLFSFVNEGETRTSAINVPAHGTKLSDLVCVNGDSIQAVGSVGPAVVVYEFYAPNE